MSRAPGKPMKLVFCTDFHGDEGHYSHLETVARQLKPDVIVLGGDMYPDDSALNPKTMGKGQPEYVRQFFRKTMLSIREASGCRHILVIFGNHDWGSSVAATRELEKERLVSVLDLVRPVTVEGLAFMGYSSTPPTPWFVKDFERLDRPGDDPPLLGGARWDARFSRPSTKSARLIYTGTKSMSEELAELKPPPAPWVLVAHSPPFESMLDRYYENQAWGSRSIRAVIEKHRPLLSLHGHIHESPDVTGSFSDHIGETLAINPGQSRSSMRYATVDIDVPARRILDAKHGRAT